MAQKKQSKSANENTLKKQTSLKSGKTSKNSKKVAAIQKDTTALVKPNKKFTREELLAFRDRLLKIRDQITGKINMLTADNLTRSPEDNNQDFRSEEQGTDNFERDFALNQVSFDQETIFEIDEALERIRLGLYGICESCQCGIEKARLQAMPFTRMCVKCQSGMEKGKRNIMRFENVSSFSTTDKMVAEGGTDEEL